MKTISVRQPWAWAIVYGGKDVENRSRPAILQMQAAIGHRVYVHASQKRPSRAEMVERKQFMASLGIVYPCIDDLDYGGVIGSVRVKDAVYVNTEGRTMLYDSNTVWRRKSPRFNGDAGFVLEDPRPVRFFAAKGRLGLFDVKRP